MPWRNRHSEHDFIFDQGQHIHVGAGLDRIELVDLELLFRYRLARPDQLQQGIDFQRPVDPAQATLAAQSKQTRGNEPETIAPIRTELTDQPVGDLAVSIDQHVGKTLQPGQSDLPGQAATLRGELEGIGDNGSLRHKGRMILFSACQVKSAESPFATGRERRTHPSRMRLAPAPSTAMKLVLASTSAYRRMLLERFELPFETARPDVDETPLPDEAPPATADRLAALKARAVAGRFPDALVIGSDQVAYMDSEVFGKPGTVERAIAQLRRMSGRTVTFHTSLALLNTCTGRTLHESVPTLVRFRALSEAEIVRYVDKERPLDCAGSAKSEGLGITLLDSLTGDDPTALIGLPLIALARMLRAEGVELP